MSLPLRAPRPGDVWRWQEPGGKWREMLVQDVQPGPQVPRACGIHPQSGRRMQCRASSLAKGVNGAELVRVVENFTYQPGR